MAQQAPIGTPFPNDVQKIWIAGYFTIPGSSPSSSNAIPQTSWSLYNVLAVVNTSTASLTLQGTVDLVASGATFLPISGTLAVTTIIASAITPFTLSPVDAIRLLAPGALPVSTSFALMGQIDPTHMRQFTV